MITKKYAILLAIALLSASAGFGQTTSPAKPAADLAYDEFAAKVRAGDTTIDFGAFRIAFSKTKAYSPYGGDREGAKAVLAALDQKKYKDAVKKAEAMLKENYVDMDAHVAASLGYEGLADTAKADFHKAVYLGLINSIVKSGDGKTAATAYVVISTREQYILLKALGLMSAGQSLVHKEGHAFDVQKTVDPKTKAESEIYFNIDIVWKAETDMFKE